MALTCEEIASRVGPQKRTLMTREQAIAKAEQAYPKEFLDFGDCHNRAECKLLVDRLAALGIITLSDPPSQNNGQQDLVSPNQ